MLADRTPGAAQPIKHTRRAGTNDDNLLPDVVLRAMVLGRVEHLSLEVFLHRLMSTSQSPIGRDTHPAWNVRDVRFACTEPKSEDDVVDVEEAFPAVVALYEDVPLAGGRVDRRLCRNR